MIKKIAYYFALAIFLTCCSVQSVFAGFEITIVNDSYLTYASIDLVLTPVGFDAMYGRISLGEITANSIKKFIYNEFEYCKVPLIEESLMPKQTGDCNLNLAVTISPKEISELIVERKFKSIVKQPQTISGEVSIKKVKTRMKGIQPPNITIIIKENSEDGITAEFTEVK